MRVFDVDKWMDMEEYRMGRVGSIDAETQDALRWDVWMDNVKANWDYARDGRWLNADLYGKKSGLSIVVGAGPTLEKNIQYLKYAQKGSAGKVYIIAVDRAYQRLVDAGIIPNLVVCADAQIEIADFIRHIDPRTRVAVSLACHPNVRKVAYEAGCRIYWYGIANPWSPFWKHIGETYGRHTLCVRGFGTVMTCAIDIAVWLGFKGIVTVGNECGWNTMEEAIADGHPEAYKVFNEVDFFTIQAYDKCAEACFLYPYFHHEEIIFKDVSGGLDKKGWGKNARFAVKEVSA